MRKKYFLLWILVCLLTVQGVTGFSVSAVTIHPSGELFADTPVTVTFEIPCKDIRLYDQLVIITDLRSPAWDARSVTEDKDTPVISAHPNGNTLTIPGAVFNLPAGQQGAIHIQLNGMVPSDPSGRNLLRIRQVDADGTEYAYPAGFDLPMHIPPAPPTATPVVSLKEPETVTPVQTTKAPSFGDLITAGPTYPSFGDLIAAEPSTSPGVSPAPVPVAENGTLSVPTSWAGEPPATASPVDPLVSIGATGGILYLIKRSRFW